MKALQVERSVARFAAARVASGWRGGAGARIGPLRLTDVDPPELPEGQWVRVRPRLSGICGSDLATVDARTSRWFEPIVTFPFVPGHELVGETEEGRRVVIEPVLGCESRGIDPPCSACAAGSTNRCERLTGGHISPGLQTGYCADVGGGWSLGLIAHRSQLHAVPEDWSDEAAVMVEPTACGVHGALAGAAPEGSPVVVIGAGTLGLVTIAALSRLRPELQPIVAVAKHPVQRALAAELGADVVAEPGELRRAVRRVTGSWVLDNGQLAGGAPLVIDCVGSPASIGDALAVTSPGGTVVLLGMPAQTAIDLTPLWQREVSLTGAYAYGTERSAGGSGRSAGGSGRSAGGSGRSAGGSGRSAGGRHSFDLAKDLVAGAGLERLVSATYTLDRHAEAIEHAAAAGRRGAVKIAFDMRRERR